MNTTKRTHGNRMRGCLAALLFVLRVSGEVTSDQFLTPIHYGNLDPAIGVAVADVDLDGKPDILAAHEGEDRLTLLLSVDTRTPLTESSFGSQLSFQLGGSPFRVLLTDLDGDGRSDILAPLSTAGRIAFFRNLHTAGPMKMASWAPQFDIPVSGTLSGVAAADLDRDGKVDLVLSDSGQTAALLVLRNITPPGEENGPQFADPVILPTAGRGPSDPAIADLDGDGKLDLIAPDANTSALVVFQNHSTSGSLGAESFSEAIILQAELWPQTVAVADVNGDGKPDIATVNTGAGSICLFENQHPGGPLTASSFSNKIVIPDLTAHYAISLVDLDFDDRPELLVVDGSEHQIVILPNQGKTGPINDATFASPVLLSTGTYQVGLVASDLNLDGNWDLVGADYKFSSLVGVTVIEGRNTGGTRPPKIIRQPRDARIEEGSTTALQASISGTGPFSYRWRKNDTDLQGESGPVLILQNLTTEHSGRYSVAIQNEWGVAESSAALITVIPGPTVLSVPDMHVIVGHAIDIPIQIKAGGNEHSVSFSLMTSTGVLTYVGASLASEAPIGSTLEIKDGEAEQGRTGFRIVLPMGATLPRGPQNLLKVSFQATSSASNTSASISFFHSPTSISSQDLASRTLRVVHTAGQLILNEQFPAAGEVYATDSFATAREIPSSLTGPVTVHGTMVAATTEDSEPSHSGRVESGSIWFTWVAPDTGKFWLGADGKDPGAFVTIYRGSSLTNLLRIGNSFDHVFTAQKGERYSLAATSFEKEAGSVVITLIPSPMNDHRRKAAELTGTQGTVHGNTRAASFEDGELPRTSSLWWKWTAPSDGEFSFSTIETGEVGVLTSVFVEDSLRSLNDISDGTAFPVAAGVTYSFRLSGGDRLHDQRGALTLRYGFKPQPGGGGNDLFADRILLTEFTNRIRADITLASQESFEAGRLAMSCQTGRSLWWRYVAPTNGFLRVAATAENQGLLIDVLKGETPRELTRLTSSCLGSVLIHAEAGEAFQIRIDQAYAAGKFDLEVDLIPPPANDSFAAGPELTGSAWDVVGHNFSASSEWGEPTAEGGSGQTVWYHWMAPFTGRAVVALRSAYTSPTARVFVGSRADALTSVRLIEQPNSIDPAFLAVAGRRYSIQIDSPWSGTFHTYLGANPLSPIVNDSFNDAVSLARNQTVSLLGASLEPGEPLHFEWPNQKTVWLKWNSYRPGKLILTPSYEWSLSPGFGLAAYVGESLTTAQLVARGTNSITVQTEAEECYHIAVISPEEAQGDAVILYEWKPTPPPPPSGTNLICSGSFEGDPFNVNLACWGFTGALSGFINERNGFDGGTWPVLPYLAQLWQEFPTEPSRQYEIRFAFTGIGAAVRILWDEREVDVVHYDSAPPDWYYVIRTATASNSVSRLTLESLGGGVHLDAVRVAVMNEQPRIIEPPTSQSVTMGGTVAFPFRDLGSPPLSYQWFFNELPMLGKTNRVLIIDGAQDRDIGDYFVVIANRFGSATSTPVQLAVEAPTGLALKMQPQSASVPEGMFLALSALAIGQAPITYQWFLEGEALVGATNRQLVFNEITYTNSGSYQLRASNDNESVMSVPAQVRVTESPLKGSFISFRNRFLRSGLVVEIPIFDVDGTTKLSGNQFVAQLYAGPTLSELHAIGQPAAFGTGDSSGIFQSTTLPLPTSGPGSRAQIQVRAWQAAAGASYEEARALGGKFGKSEIFEVPAEPMQLPLSLDGLMGFSLKAGLPRLNVGVIRLMSVSPTNETTWALIGEKGFRYLIERSESDFVWHPWLVLTNSSGETLFRDMIPRETTGPRFYRSRILD